MLSLLTAMYLVVRSVSSQVRSNPPSEVLDPRRSGRDRTSLNAPVEISGG